jgi:hypothetical protein
MRSYLKSNQSEKGGGAQVIEGLPSTCKALSSMPSTAKKKMSQT